ncbi:MAG: MFS transporter [Lachnospiraceae bacterium]|nr:MFS transporter [Lachnospiraceae bacterium]
MKLNFKRTFFVGFAFLSICAFWQLYDGVVPLILTKTFKLDETFTGVIMAADNVLALFLLPFFGGLSDKANTKIGKRMPFILFGTGCAIILMNILPLLDNSYAASGSPFKLVSFIVVLGLLLVAMGTYRSPAVALMPDVTPKPLRSKANAVINLMGTIGGAIYLGLAAVLYPTAKTKLLEHVNYQPIFLIVSAIMFVAVGLLFILIKEKKLVEETQALEAEHPEWNLAETTATGKEVLPKPVKRSLGFLLASIALWFIAYNGVSTWFTTYVDQVMGEGLGGASTCLLIGTIGAAIMFIPIGIIASKIGRKKMIMIGVALLSTCFLLATLMTWNAHKITIPMYILFAVVGAAWAAINVNSLPMVVEMCKGSDVGKFTGFYYTASMAAQVVTPIVAGFLMKHISYRILFPYSMVFAALAFVTMIFVKHGDQKVEAKKGIEAFEDFED